MKKQLTVVSILGLCVVLAVFILSCSPTPQNTNQANNANNSNGNTVVITSPCSKASIEADMDKIVKNVGIENQHTGNGNPNNYKYFQFRVIEEGSQKVLIIQGGISDGKKNDPSSNSEFMEKLIKDVDQLVKKDCVFKAVFVKYGTLEALDKGQIKTEDIEGFDWSACEWPMVACAGGVCSENCLSAESLSKTASNANYNSNSNANANANKNSNSNTNKNANTNRTP
jgi:hypothetical protein